MTPLSNIFLYLSIFYIGSILGSFFLVIATRLPSGGDVLFSRSKCDYCSATLKWYNLIPIFSYIIQLGKCSKCKNKIPIIHLIIEIITGLGFVLLFYKFGFGYNFFISIVLFSILVIISISDFKYLIILDSPLVVSAAIILFLQLKYLPKVDIFYNIISGISLFFLMYVIGRVGNYLFKRESLGGGDIKFSFLIGLVLGFKLSLIALILSTFLALPASFFTIVNKKEKEIPFGPFLSGALLIVFMFYDKFNLLFYLI